LLDSVVVIDHFNGIKPATEFLLEYGDECALSAITRAEVLTGFQLKAEPLACELLDVFSTLPLTAKTADSAARLRRSERLKLPDAFQAAVASEHDLTLVTWNTRDFRPGNSPKVLVPYRL
jgi:predicted nucleic acid-binding protein